MDDPHAALDCWYLTGPTASGKTEASLALAEQIDAEIISLDSMAVYRGMDVGTAKPTVEQRRRIAHHLIDVARPDEDYSLARYVAEAHAAIEAIRGRGRQVLFVGGTPLYLKALLRGIFSGPPADWEFRHTLESEARQHEADYLHRRLAEVDPVAAGRLHARDTRRLIRALEVYEKTGRPISDWQQQFDQPRFEPQRSRAFWLNWPRESLYARIERRVDAMFAAGLVDEVRTLVDQYGELSRTARQAVGYREVLDHFQQPGDLDEVIALVKTRTRQFARRQLTWFRRLSECRPVEVAGEEEPRQLADRILELAPLP